MLMTDLVKSLAEVYHRGISLVSLVEVCAYIVKELQHLGLARQLTAEPMPEVEQDLVLVTVIKHISLTSCIRHEITHPDVFEHRDALVVSLVPPNEGPEQLTIYIKYIKEQSWYVL